MASHYFAIILIACAFCSIGGIEARRFCTTPEALNAGEVKPSSVVRPPSPKWATSRGVEDWDPPTPTKPTPSPKEEPAPCTAEEPAVPGTAEEPLPVPVTGEVPPPSPDLN